MKKTIITIGAIIMGIGQALPADNVTTTTTTTANDNTNAVVTERTTIITLSEDHRMYRAPELDIDGFGAAAFRQSTIEHLSPETVHHQTRLGVGAGFNFFFLRMVGIGAHAYSFDTHHAFIDNLSGDLTLHFPILDSGFAPYMFAGGGHKWDRDEANFAEAGAGFEFRFHPNIGFFVDGRWTFVHRLDNYALGRAGLRFAF